MRARVSVCRCFRVAITTAMLALAAGPSARISAQPQFTTGPSVRVTTNASVEFKWIANVSWFGEVAVYDNADAAGMPVSGMRDEDAGGSPVAATQHTVAIPIEAPLAANTDYFFQVTATDPNGSLPSFMTLTPLPPFFTGVQSIGIARAESIIPNGVVISWEANVIGYGSVAYGTTALDQGPVEDTFNITNHAIEITGLSPGTTYQFRVSNKHAIDGSSLAEAIGQFTTDDTVPVEVSTWGSTPADELLLRIGPNPCRDVATIRFSMRAAGAARLSVYDTAGRRVRDFRVTSASQSVTWDGTDDNGRTVAAGTYVLRLQDGRRSVAGRVTLIR